MAYYFIIEANLEKYNRDLKIHLEMKTLTQRSEFLGLNTVGQKQCWNTEKYE